MIGTLVGSAIGTIAGGGIDDIFAKASADRSYEMNRRLQKHDQEFQKEMRATQYQTTVEDMQKAGINPAVALSGGAALSSGGGGSSASASAPKAEAVDIATAAMGLKTQQQQIVNQTALTNADVGLKQSQALKTIKEAGYTDQQIKNAAEEYKLIQEQIQNAKTERELAEAQKKAAEWDAKHPVLSKVLPGAPGLVGMVAGGLMAGPVGAAIGSNIMNTHRRKIGF